MLSIDDREIKNFERDLKTFASKAYPFATKQTLNQSARQAMNFAKDHVREKMINRNKFTVQSIRFEQTKTLNVDRQESLMGSTEDYMSDQEFGGVKRSQKGDHVSLSTNYSSGEPLSARRRRRLPRKANKLPNIKLGLGGRVKSKSRLQSNFVKIRMASRLRNKFVFLNLGRRKGIFKVIGKGKKAKVRMLHDMTRRSVVIKKNPWLAPATQKAVERIPEIYFEALKFQMKRQGLFK